MDSNIVIVLDYSLAKQIRRSFMTGGLYRQEVLYDMWSLHAGGPL